MLEPRIKTCVPYYVEREAGSADTAPLVPKTGLEPVRDRSRQILRIVGNFANRCKALQYTADYPLFSGLFKPPECKHTENRENRKNEKLGDLVDVW